MFAFYSVVVSGVSDVFSSLDTRESDVVVFPCLTQSTWKYCDCLKISLSSCQDNGDAFSLANDVNIRDSDCLFLRLIM